jgi:hypothetical protein
LKKINSLRSPHARVDEAAAGIALIRYLPYNNGRQVANEKLVRNHIDHSQDHREVFKDQTPLPAAGI